MRATVGGAIDPGIRVASGGQGRARRRCHARTVDPQYPRFGYRRIHVFLERQGHVMSPDRAHRLWRQNGLQVPRHRPRRRISTGRPRPLLPERVNHVWTYDFVFDACANGQQLKCLTVVEEYSRDCLAIDVAGSIRSGRVIQSCPG